MRRRFLGVRIVGFVLLAVRDVLRRLRRRGLRVLRGVW